MSLLSRIKFAPIIVGLFAAGAVVVHAQTIWTGGAGTSDWHTEGNWSDGLPGVDNWAEIRTGGATVDLTQNVTMSGGPFRVLAFDGDAAPVTLNISADLDTDGEAWRIGDREGTTTHLRAIVNQTAGDVTVGNMTVGDNVGSGTSADSPTEYNLQSGTLTVGGSIEIGEAASGFGRFTMQPTGGQPAPEFTVTGTMSVGKASAQQAGVGTFLMTGGTATVGNTQIGRDKTGHVTVAGGSFTSGIVRLGAQRSASGTFEQYGAANVNFTGDLDIATRFGAINSSTTGTYRAVIDRTGFNALDLEGNLNIGDGESPGPQGGTQGTGHLEVALAGGVLLSGTNAYDLITIGGITNGDWTTTPGVGELWEATTDNEAVSVALRAAQNRGSVDASALNVTVAVDGGSQTVGYVELNNVVTSEELQLRLMMEEASVGDDSVNLLAFLADLDMAGYTASLFGDYGLNLTLDPELNGAEYFAWDLSEYSSNPTLALESITVIPEPATTGLVVLGLAALAAILRRRSVK